MKQFKVAPALLLWLAVTADAVAQTATTATESTTSSATTSAGSFFQVLLGLIVVLALMAAAAWTLKKFGVSKLAGNAPVRIVGGVSVGNRERVLVVEVGDQWIVVGVAPGQVNALSTMPRQETAAAPEVMPVAKNFSAWLKQTIEKRSNTNGTNSVNGN
ncbi:MAG: flagellar biosynthetic protein FliO [Burkholderiaceae bacterium]